MEKSKMKTWKNLLIIFFIILAIFMIITLRKFIILTNIEKVSKNIMNNNNYYAEIYSLQGNNVSIRKSYNKDSKYLSTFETFGANIPETRKVTIYNDEKGQTGIIQAGENKIAILDESMLGGQVGINTFSTYDMGFWNKMLLAIISRITTEQCSNKECYLVETENGLKMWVEKDSGLILREINSGNVIEYNYKFNIVRDDDILKPDISDCKIRKNN